MKNKKDRLLLESEVIAAVDKHTNDYNRLDDDITCILEEVQEEACIITIKFEDYKCKDVPDHLLKTLEKDNSKIYAYNVAGMKIKCEENFVNKTESMRLIFSGKGKVLDGEITFKETIYIDTDTYDRYDWNIKNGILYVTLYEKINPRPDFKRVDKPTKKTAVEEENK